MSFNNEALQPKMWASAFEEIDKGMFNLHKIVVSKTELSGATQGQSMVIPIPDDVTDAVSWDGESIVSNQNTNQKTTEIALTDFFAKKIKLTAKDLSMNPYDLMQAKAVPMAEGMIQTLNRKIYNEMLATPNFIDGRVTFNEDTIIDLKNVLDINRVSLSMRKLLLSSTDMTSLLKLPAFKNADMSGSQEVQNSGFITKKFGLDFSMNHAIDRYIPGDLLGNNVNVGIIGQTSFTVNNFTDSVNPIKKGDIFTVASETGSPLHTVIDTIRTLGVTTTIVFSPPLISAIAINQIITVIPTRSVLAFTPNSTGLGMATLYLTPPELGHKCEIFNIDGFPVRISVWADDSTSVNLQMDALIGVKLVNPQRVAKILR